MRKLLATPQPLTLAALILDMLLAFVLSGLMAAYYARFGEALSNRVKFAKLLPFLTLITVLVISVIKSSLALSLGLVGALSIVRFRTAIKEPEELVYLFLAIAIGLGMGADQRTPTLIAVSLIFVLLILSRLLSPRLQRRNLYVNVQLPAGNDNASAPFHTINDIFSQHADFVDMRRLDQHQDTLQLTYFLKCKDQAALAGIIDAMQHQLPGSSLTFVDQNNMPGV